MSDLNITHCYRDSWDEYFIEMCKVISSKSKDPSTVVGCVAVDDDDSVLSTGFNGFPRGVGDCCEKHADRYERPAKYDYTEHGERNTIYNAARTGVSLNGATLYMEYEPFPCIPCARGVIQAGIKRIIGTSVPFPGRGEQWERELEFSKGLLTEAGVEMIIALKDEEDIHAFIR